MTDRSRSILWFKKDIECTVTGYRWLDALIGPYWSVTGWLAARRLWQLMAVGDETWRESRDRTRAFYRVHPELLDRDATND